MPADSIDEEAGAAGLTSSCRMTIEALQLRACCENAVAVSVVTQCEALNQKQSPVMLTVAGPPDRLAYGTGPREPERRRVLGMDRLATGWQLLHAPQEDTPPALLRRPARALRVHTGEGQHLVHGEPICRDRKRNVRAFRHELPGSGLCPHQAVRVAVRLAEQGAARPELVGCDS